jgi:hypothetical protein
MNMPAAQPLHRPGGLRGLLLPDHNDRLELMLDEVLLHWESTGGRGPFPVWSRFLLELKLHLETEERWVFPPFEVAHSFEAAAMRSQHNQLRALASKAENELSLQARAAPSLLALQRHLRAHAQEEDRLFHPWAVQHLDAEAWKSVRRAMRALMFNVSHEREEP